MNWHFRKAFTVVEALVVIAIIVVVAAIMTPVLQTAKKASKVSNAVSNMKQLYIAIQQYRHDYDGSEATFQFHALGLPTAFGFERELYPATATLWPSPCGFNQGSKYLPPVIKVPGWVTYAPGFYDPQFTMSGGNSELNNYLSDYRENSVLLLDVNCSEGTTSIEDIMDNYTEKRRLSVLLSGRLINGRRAGNALRLQFYSDVPSS